MTRRIAIIGGGAAGMIVATTLLERDDLDTQIHLFEKNSRLGAKVIISGGGRCNVTTGFFKIKELITKYPRGAAFLRPALEQFGPRAIRRRFESYGVPLKEEDDHRIFPVSDDGKDIVAVFERLFKDKRIHVHLKEGVREIAHKYVGGLDAKDAHVAIAPQHDACLRAGFLVTTDKKNYTFDAVVLTTGGNAYAHTGSTGDGYAWARALGHSITPLGPSLNSFLTAEEWLYPCSGISFVDAQVVSGDAQITTRGPLLLTHFGLSGPAVFAFSSHIPHEPVSKDHPYEIRLQPDAARGVAEWQHELTVWAVETPQKELGSLLRGVFPKKFVDAVLSQFGYDPHTIMSTLKKEGRHRLAQLLGDGVPLTLIQRRPGDEFVTAGGVSLDEVDPESGQSRLVPGLYFAGEILDVDGYTGGYNLTSSWAMGRLVGKSIMVQ